MIKKILVLTLAIILQTNVFASPFLEGSIQFSSIFKGWTKTLGKTVKIDIPYDFRLIIDKEPQPTTLSELADALKGINTILMKVNYAPLQACVFDDLILIIPSTIEKCTANN